jgi:hypothetical protein
VIRPGRGSGEARSGRPPRRRRPRAARTRGSHRPSAGSHPNRVHAGATGGHRRAARAMPR